jgi:hypothetical protein
MRHRFFGRGHIAPVTAIERFRPHDDFRGVARAGRLVPNGATSGQWRAAQWRPRFYIGTGSGPHRFIEATVRWIEAAGSSTLDKLLTGALVLPFWNEENDLGLISNDPEELPGTFFVSSTGRAYYVFENYDLGESQNSFQIVQLQSAFFISNVIAAHWIVVRGLLAMLRNINNTTQP